MRYSLLKKTCTIAVMLIMIGITIIPSVSSNISTNENKIQTDNETEYYAVIAACSEYKDNKLNIPKPPFIPISEQKLKCLYDSLIETENWNESNIILLLNKQATKQNITNALEEMTTLVGPNDIFLFSWQGHGSEALEDPFRGPIDEECGMDEVICPHDCYRNEKGYLVNYITDDELDKQFDQINTKGMCLIFECCLSGGLVNINSNASDEDTNNLSIGPLDLDKDNKVVIMSTRPGVLGRATFLKGFPLTQALARSLKKQYSDKNKDGFISAEEAFSWAKPRAKIQSLFYWFSIWGLNCIIFKAGSIDYPVLKSTITTLMSLIILQSISYKKNNHYMYNRPNIIDGYEGDLQIVKN